MAKPKISSDWLAGCAGCHMSLLDMDERIIQIAELADLRATPITDLKEPDESGVAGKRNLEGSAKQRFK